MEKHIGRARFQGTSVKFRDEANQHGRMERELYPGADPGDPDAGGERIDDEALAVLIEAAKKLRALSFDDEDPVPNEGLAVLIEAAKKLRALSFTDPPEAPTPMETFKRASDRRHNPEGAAARAKVGDMSKMTPMQRFKALSKSRWGF